MFMKSSFVRETPTDKIRLLFRNAMYLYNNNLQCADTIITFNVLIQKGGVQGDGKHSSKTLRHIAVAGFYHTIGNV